MNRKSFLVGLLAAGCFVATSALMTSPGNAQADPKVAKAMEILKAETAKLGAPKVEGTDQTADKTTPGLYFGSTKVNNDFTIVDKVKAEAGGTATIFVKSVMIMSAYPPMCRAAYTAGRLRPSWTLREKR